MFFIGILSTPIPFSFIALAYLVVLSTGMFDHDEHQPAEEELSAKIISCEQVTRADVPEKHTAFFTHFCSSKTRDHSPIIQFSHFWLSPKDAELALSRPIELGCYHYIRISEIFSRPPPAVC